MTEPSPPVRGARLAWLTFLTYYAIVSFGFCLVITGSALPEIRRSLDLDASRAGLLTSLWSLGFLISTAIAGGLADRIDNRVLLALGSLVISASLCLFGRSAWLPANLLLQFALGGGVGIYEGTLNALTVRLYPRARATALNVLHAMLGVGTVSGPILTAAVAGRGLDYKVAFLLVGAFSLLLLPLVLLTRFPRPGPTGGEAAARRSPFSQVIGLMKVPTFALLCAAMAFYVGVEYGTNVWITTYLEEAKSAPVSLANRVLSLFWAGLLAGRLATSFLARFVSNRAIAISLSISAGITLAMGLESRSPLAIEVCFAFFGLSLSGIFPTLLSMAGEDHPELAGSAMGVIVSIGFVGAFVMPWSIASTFRSLGIGSAMYLYLVGILCLVAAVSLYAAAHVRGRG